MYQNLFKLELEIIVKKKHKRMINLGDKGDCLYDTAMQAQIATGKSLEEVFYSIYRTASKNVYISIDIDGLEPLNCPNTGTPVPGGLRYGELEHLIFMVVKVEERL